jgi:hypothetical protein
MLRLGSMAYDPAGPLGKMFFNTLATCAEFEVDLLRLRTRDGMAIARAKGRLKGRAPKLSSPPASAPGQAAHRPRATDRRPGRAVRGVPSDGVPRTRPRRRRSRPVNSSPRQDASAGRSPRRRLLDGLVWLRDSVPTGVRDWMEPGQTFWSGALQSSTSSNGSTT